MSTSTSTHSKIGSLDTVTEDERPRLEAFHKLETGNTYSGFFYDRSHVWLKIHNADTHEVIAEEKFKGNGRAMEYVLQFPGAKAEDYTLDGPKAGSSEKGE